MRRLILLPLVAFATLSNWAAASETIENYKGPGCGYEGEVANGLPNGYGKHWCTEFGNGRVFMIYEGDWKNGRWHGQGKMYDLIKGTIVYQGPFCNNDPGPCGSPE